MSAPPAPALSRTTVIVVTYNSAHCIAPLAAGLRHMPHVVVVDNASVDDTAAQVARHLPQARWCPLPANQGFGAANNVGVQLADTEFVLLLNPDCVLQCEAVEALVATAERFADAAAVAPQLLDRQQRRELSHRWRSDRWPSRGPGAEAVACVGFASGACLLVRTAAMRRIGGFDESFFLYYEDDDLCIRLQQHGGALLFEPSACVQHLSRGSVGGPARRHAEFVRGYHHIQSKFRFQAKHLGRRVAGPVRLRYAAVALLEALARLLILDLPRAWRCAGRMAGAAAYRP